MAEDGKKKLEKAQEDERKQIEKEKATQAKEDKKEREKIKDDYEKKEKKEKQKMKKQLEAEEYTLSAPVQLVNIIVGFIFMILPGYILINEDVVTSSAIIIFAAILGLAGLSRLFNAFYDRHIGGTKRLIQTTFAAILIILSIIAFLEFSFGEGTLLLILSVGLIVQALGRLHVGFTHPVMPTWLRMLLVIVAAIGGIIGLWAIFIEDSNEDIVTLLSIGFFLAGISRVGRGLGDTSFIKKRN